MCHERKAALSPYAVAGEHDDLGKLPKTWIDVIHRVTTDSGRLTRRWVDESIAGGVLEDELVEIISVSIITTTIDAFAAGIGMDVVGLPTVQSGMPLRQHYQAATPGPGWISTTAPENAGPELTDLYADEKHFNIKRTLTLVPDEAMRFWALMDHLYLADPRVNELDAVDRDISRAQIEFLAARCSALLGCYY